MPNESNVLVARTDYDDATHVLHEQVAPEFINYAINKMYRLIDCDKPSRYDLESAIYRFDPAVCFLLSHGVKDAVISQDRTIDLLGKDNAMWMNGRFVYNVACLTGVELAPALIINGARAVYAFTDVLTIMVDENLQIVEGFKECLTKPKHLLDGYSCQEVYNMTLAEYEKWINYWDEKDPTVADVLRHDRDNFKLFGTGESRITLSFLLLTGHMELILLAYAVLYSIYNIIRLYRWWTR